ncbi:hypothetical protein ACCUM_3254 [Candidatus Accumulibacter phosphatis]|uniref:Uncharacterized protein n=1 Tax=Candidatus Accumulibacter phosphatis TaxID=327160 RepID=A0A5S4EHF9_9PROT|nr:hypothetical protein ACCUM_3254 [Candidatus Accumulibacter phosphatis]
MTGVAVGQQQREEGVGQPEHRQREADDAEQGERGECQRLADHRLARQHEVGDQVGQREAATLQGEAVLGKASSSRRGRACCASISIRRGSRAALLAAAA